MEQSDQDAKTAGIVTGRMRDLIMPRVFNRVYERSTA